MTKVQTFYYMLCYLLLRHLFGNLKFVLPFFLNNNIKNLKF